MAFVAPTMAQEGHGILIIAEPFDYRFPDGTQAYLHAFQPPLLDRGRAFFSANEGGWGTWVQFIHDDRDLIRVMDNVTPFPGSDPPVLPWLLRADAFRGGVGLSLLNDPITPVYGLALVRPSEPPQRVADTLPPEPGEPPAFTAFGTSLFVGEHVVFQAVGAGNITNHFKHDPASGGTTPVFADPGALSIEGVAIRWLHGPVTADDTRVVAMADLEPDGEAIPVTYDLDGNLEALAWLGDPIPGGGTVDQVSPEVLGISGANHVVLAISGEAPDIRHVLMGTMDGRPDDPEVFVTSGDPVPGSPGLVFLAFEALAMAHDSFVFRAAFEDSGTRHGLYLWKDGQVTPIYDNREELAGRTISTIGLDDQGFDGDFVGFLGHFGGNLDGVFLTRVRPWPATITEWKEASFTPEELANEAISGDAANPDGDAFTNFLEYVTGQAPKRADVLEPPRIEDGHAVFAFPVAYGVGDFSVEAEFSDGLSGWDADAVEIAESEDAPEHEWITVRTVEPVTQRIRGFFRLAVRPVGMNP